MVCPLVPLRYSVVQADFDLSVLFCDVDTGLAVVILVDLVSGDLLLVNLPFQARLYLHDTSESTATSVARSARVSIRSAEAVLRL